MIELLNKPSAAESWSVVPRPASKLSTPAEDAASIFFDSASSTRELISRTDSDSMCATSVPGCPSTSIPFLKVPAHNLPCESIDNAEIRLLVSDWRLSPQREKRIVELSDSFTAARYTPSLLSSHRSLFNVASLEPVETVALFQVAGMVRRRCERSSSALTPNVSLLSLHNTSFPP